MIAVESFRPEHFDQLELQPAQEHMREHLTPSFLSKLASSAPAFTVRDNDRVLVCFGFYRWNQESGIVWAYPARDLGRRMLRVHRFAERAIDALAGNIFAAVEHDFEEGSRWMDLLGFERIGHLDQYGLAGRPHDIYVRMH